MSDTWFHERTATGWEVRDESRLLVAVVPDPLHERETDAARIAGAGCPAGRTTRMARAVGLLTETLETEIGVLRERIRALVLHLTEDARAIAERVQSTGPDAASATWIAMHVREMTEAQGELAAKRQQLQELRHALALADGNEARS